LLIRQHNLETRAFTGLPRCRDGSIVTFHDLAANSQPYAGSTEFAGAVQALEYLKDLLTVLLFETDTIVAIGNPAAAIRLRVRRYVNDWRVIG
jgi:hypothetical protein